MSAEGVEKLGNRLCKVGFKGLFLKVYTSL